MGEAMKVKFSFYSIKNPDALYTYRDVPNPFGDAAKEKVYHWKEYCESVMSDVISERTEFSDLQYVGQVERIANEVFLVGADHVYTIGFTLDTYENGKTYLEVSIESDYSVDATDDFEKQYDRNLELLKISLKNRLKKDWQQCVWLYDEQSELLCSKLYPDVFRIENDIRAFATKVLRKNLGNGWISLNGLGKYHNIVKSNEAEFKQFVRDFADIDSTALSLTLEMLQTIISEGKVYDTSFALQTEDVDRILKKIDDGNTSAVYDLIEKKRVVQKDIWNDIFAILFDPNDNFQSLMKAFIKDRNHIAHNKLLNWQAFNIILKEFNDLESSLQKATEKAETQDPSEELLETWQAQAEQDAEEQEYEKYYYRDRLAAETGVEILTSEKIFEKFCSSIAELYDNIFDRYHFDNCFEVTDYCKPSPTEKTEVCSVICNAATDEEVQINVEFEIDDEPEGQSIAHIVCIHGNDVVAKADISYSNGSGHEGESGEMVADYESEYDESQLNDLKSDLYAYIENELNPYIAELEALSYRYGKDGGPDITADFVCEFCGKDGVSVLKEFYPVGYCCFCGNENSYRECQICGKIYDYDSEDKDFCPECRPRDLDDE